MVLSVGVLLGGLVTAYVLHTIWQWRRLAHVPGPFLAGFSKYGMAMETLRFKLPTYLEQLNHKYGTLWVKPRLDVFGAWPNT
jgi:O-antigen/teichoic acid export membrane protein